MRVQKGGHGLGFVGGHVVHNHMDLPALRLCRDDVAEEFDEGSAGMPRHGLPDDLAGAGIQRRVQRERPMPVVLKAMAFRATGRQRQDGVQAIEGLNGRRLIGGEDGRMLRRVEIQAENIRRFRLEGGIIGQHVPLELVGLQTGAAPHPRDQHMTDAEDRRQPPRAPVGTAIRRALPGLRQDARLHRRRPDGRGLAAILRPQPRDPFGLEALFPAADIVGVAPDRRGDRGERRAVGEHQNHLRAPGVFGPNPPAAHALLQFGAFVIGQRQRHMAREYTTSDSVETVH
jgi:hypothetical protein